MSEKLHAQGVSALWLVTGKKLDTTKGCVITEKGLIVRTSDTGFLTIPMNAIVAIETFTSSKEELDKVFNGQNTAEAKA